MEQQHQRKTMHSWVKVKEKMELRGGHVGVGRDPEIHSAVKENIVE